MNAAFCLDGRCVNDAAACQYACQYLGHGQWVSTAGGGPFGGVVTPADAGTHVTPGNDAGEPVTGSCGVFQAGADSCSSCVVDSCCAQARRCDVGSRCAAYSTCLDDCFGDVECEDACYFNLGGGAPDYVAFRDCLRSACSFECG